MQGEGDHIELHCTLVGGLDCKQFASSKARAPPATASGNGSDFDADIIYCRELDKNFFQEPVPAQTNGERVTGNRVHNRVCGSL